MKKEYRVKTHQDFQKVIHCNKKLVSNSFVVYYVKNNFSHARVGISTSKKLGNAVTRNRIRRQVRVMAKQAINFASPNDYCIIVRDNFLKKEFKSNNEELANLIKKIKQEDLR